MPYRECVVSLLLSSLCPWCSSDHPFMLLSSAQRSCVQVRTSLAQPACPCTPRRMTEIRSLPLCSSQIPIMYSNTLFHLIINFFQRRELNEWTSAVLLLCAL